MVEPCLDGWYDGQHHRLPWDVLERMSSRIINEVRGINRVCHDIGLAEAAGEPIEVGVGGLARHLGDTEAVPPNFCIRASAVRLVMSSGSVDGRERFRNSETTSGCCAPRDRRLWGVGRGKARP